jgi:nucleotide-binding universal stress UspA family protein/predicted RNA-binding Zn-ribbon protein involved in translation (DUF1610 family)
MYTVLLPVDASEPRATAQAATAANLPNADEEVVAHLLHVFDSRERAESTDPTQIASGETAREFLEREGVRVETKSRHGNPASEILAAAGEVDADMIMMGGRKRSPLGSALFGSVSQQVTLDSDIPVVVTGEREESGLPSHRCQSCGEEYFSESDVEIATCRNCGGAKVERIEREEPPAA